MEAELPLVQLLARLLGMILSQELEMVEIKRISERIRTEAMTDFLTGLLNRRGWSLALEAEELRARRYGSPTCIFIIDLDDLKEVNDSQGHEMGDRLIQRAADIVRSEVRESDTVARLGGDEFGIMAVECNRETANEMLARLRETLADKGIKASLGMAPRDPAQGINEAVVQADRNMYREKSRR